MPSDSAPFDLNSVYLQLEQAKSPDNVHGLTQRRIATKSSCDLFAAVQKPANCRVLLIRFHSEALPPDFELPKFRSLELEENRVTEDGKERLLVLLRSPQTNFNDVFTSLAEDISRHVSGHIEQASAAAAFLRRLIQWQRLLQRQAWDGLTSEEQRGLYGELWFLNETVLDILPGVQGVNSWTGPEAAAKDFQFAGGIAAEVKTTLSRQPQTLIISNERQLDDAGFMYLYLVHLSVEAVRGTGDTLPNLVQRVRTKLSADAAAHAVFEEHLLDAGYFDVHASNYETTGYTWRGHRLYHVADGFPRIIEQDLKPGVGEVHYSISASACQPFAVEFTEISTRIGIY